MKRIVILPYKMESGSAKDLADALGVRRVYPDRLYKPRSNDLIVNWGYSSFPQFLSNLSDSRASEIDILNQPEAVKIASNKLLALQRLKEAGIAIPRFTPDKLEASRKFGTVYARTVLNGNSGEGIIYVPDQEMLPDAPLYVEGLKTKAEYRVHVFGGQVISYAKKMRDLDYPNGEPNENIRSHNNGWVFCRDGLRRLERIEHLAIEAVSCLGLDFGGVDIVRDEDNNCFVLEVNTACGIEGQTLQAYVEAIQNYANRE